MKGSDVIYKAISKYTDKAFIYSGGAIMPLIDKFYGKSFKTYINSNEQCTALSAVGYAKSSNKTGLCIVTSGPGLTNCVTGITDAYTDSVPMVVLSGQVSTNVLGTQAFQEAPSVNITKSITKWSYQPKNVEELQECIHEAFITANSGKPGPVHIDLCKNLLVSDVVENEIYPKSSKRYETIEFNKLISMATAINQSKRPVIILGKGCNKIPNKVRDFCINLNIPVTTTIHAMGIIDETSELSLKFLGMHGSAVANYAVQKSDCIINFGSRFDDRIIGDKAKFAPEAIIIHCNIEIGDINKTIKANHSFNGDVGFLIDVIRSYINTDVDRKDWFDTINELKNTYKFEYKRLINNDCKQQDVIVELNKYIDKKNTIITSGVGNHQMYACQFIDWTHPNTFLSSGSLGVMGAGLPYAIGAQIANPDKMVIDLDGDGSFNMTLTELSTVARYRLPIKIIILDDGYLSMVKVWEDLFYERRFVATDLPNNPNYYKLAQSFGITSLFCNRRDKIKDTIVSLLTYSGPVLAHFKVETDKCFPLVPPGAALDEMIFNDNNNSIKNLLPPS